MTEDRPHELDVVRLTRAAAGLPERTQVTVLEVYDADLMVEFDVALLGDDDDLPIVVVPMDAVEVTWRAPKTGPSGACSATVGERP
jgi:hypothetical protein